MSMISRLSTSTVVAFFSGTKFNARPVDDVLKVINKNCFRDKESTKYCSGFLLPEIGFYRIYNQQEA